ncbi:hypothetical protein BGZ80_003097 [Entomortierella chlamydospora]|uniref:Uncharacterized protein n=1 Tax=Entomortierella chlamydospora TaxID=101097 RepID=A0A9P6N4N0_9FUNG|nr:hypothetical protein BGZ79_000011 [Entomortierella chlamydospora]KAG0024429.1 hypothetical protein BGZ80_003097 [Entomortierella chlamydospora]
MNNQTANKSKHSGHAEEQRQPTNTQTDDGAPATSADIHTHSNDRSHHLEHRSSRQVNGGSISTSKRHSYNGGQSKTRPLIKSTTTGTKLASHGRRRRAKFVFGDQELEKEAHPDEERHLQQTPSIEGPSTDREQISQHERPGHPSGKLTPQENQDSGHGPNSETIPNVDRRNHPRCIEPLGATGRSGAGKAKTAEDSVSIRLIQPSGSALQQDHPANDKHLKQTHTSDHRNDQRAVSLPDREDGPENPTGSASTSTAKHSCHIPRSNTSPSVERQPNCPMQPELSKRLSHLLHPSYSTTSLPSITRTISHPVLSTISPVQSISDGSDHHSEEEESATISALSATLKSEQPQINPVVDLVSKFLNPYTTMRSRSHSNLSALATSSLGTNNDMFGLNRYHQQQRSGSMGTSVYSPPRTNDSSPYLISRFLPNSPSQPSQPLLASSPRLVSSSTLTTSPTAITPPQQLPLSQIKKRRLPAGLQMTVAAYSPESGSSTQDQVVLASSAPTTSTAPPRPTSPVSISSVYSSAEGRPQYQSPDPGNSISSPWNSVESMSRTQQKLMLQKECTQDDLDKHEIVRRGRAMREMDKIQRDYRCVRMYADPILDSLARCKAGQEIEWKLLQTQKDARLRADLQNSIASMSVKSM